MRCGKPWLLAEYDTQMEANRYHNRVDRQVTRVESDRPTCQHENDRNVHRIPRKTVQAHDNELLGRSPRRESASTCHVEVAHCPEQQNDSDCQWQEADTIERATSWSQQEKRNRERNDARQSQDGDERSPEQAAGRPNGQRHNSCFNVAEVRTIAEPPETIAIARLAALQSVYTVRNKQPCGL